MGSGYEEWDKFYRSYPLDSLPWELGKPRKILVDLVKSGQIRKGRALDLCCGAGSNTVYLAQQGFKVTAIDISSRAVEYAVEKAKTAGVEIEFMVENFVQLPFKDEEFDFVFDMGCFHHVKERHRSQFIRGVHRVLKPEGVYFMVCFSYKNGRGWNHFTRQDLVRLFSDYFTLKKIQPISSVEADGYKRYFYAALMEKK